MQAHPCDRCKAEVRSLTKASSNPDWMCDTCWEEYGTPYISYIHQTIPTDEQQEQHRTAEAAKQVQRKLQLAKACAELEANDALHCDICGNLFGYGTGDLNCCNFFCTACKEA